MRIPFSGPAVATAATLVGIAGTVTFMSVEPAAATGDGCHTDGQFRNCVHVDGSGLHVNWLGGSVFKDNNGAMNGFDIITFSRGITSTIYGPTQTGNGWLGYEPGGVAGNYPNNTDVCSRYNFTPGNSAACVTVKN